MATALQPIAMNDADLVAASRNGNREAFGQIVRKYQAMISGLIYAACGDLHRSEDIAQETFIAAWKSLSGLRDPAKLPGWLCKIARRRIADYFREPATQKIQLQEQLAETIPAEQTDRAMSAEESEMLWRTLSSIPQPYRETMVLYYRQGQSTAEVAAAMETTDAGVRQRLSRGRQMLREELAAMVERNLARSAPGPEFALAVMAALPMAAAPAAAATAAAKGSAAAKGGFFFFLFNWFAPLLGAISMGWITIESIRRAQTSRSRRFLVGYWILFWMLIAAWIVGCNLLAALGHHRRWDYPTSIPVFAAAACVFAMGMLGLMAWYAARQTSRRQFNRTWKNFRLFWPKFIFLAPLIYCGVGWMVNLAVRAGDYFAAGIIAALAIAGSAVCAWRSTNQASHDPLKMACESWLLMTAITMIALTARLRSWIAVVDHIDFAELSRRVPLWSINLCGIILIFWTILLMLRQKRQSELAMRS